MEIQAGKSQIYNIDNKKTEKKPQAAVPQKEPDYSYVDTDNILNPINDILMGSAISNLKLDTKQSFFISPSDKILKSTIDAVKQVPGNSWVGRLPSNGNREVAIMIPNGVDPKKPVELIYYFHGKYTHSQNESISESLLGRIELKDAINNMAQKGKNVIVIMPQGPQDSLLPYWMSGNENMITFQSDTEKIIKEKMGFDLKVGSITMKGHSAGGQPIRNAAREGTLKADKIDYLDASYGHWALETYNTFVAKNPSTEMNVYYIANNSTGTLAGANEMKNKPGANMVVSANLDHFKVPKCYFDF